MVTKHGKPRQPPTVNPSTNCERNHAILYANQQELQAPCATRGVRTELHAYASPRDATPNLKWSTLCGARHSRDHLTRDCADGCGHGLYVHCVQHASDLSIAVRGPQTA